MFNLNNPKLTKQQKEYLLALQTDKDFKQEVDREKAQGNNICFPSYWVVNVEDLIRFNKGAHQIDSCFDFEKEGLEQIHPHFECVLFEGERVEIGEWDETYKRWSSHSYQRVGVLFIQGIFEGFKEDGFTICQPVQIEEEDRRELEILYPFSFGEKAPNKFSWGMIDIPLHLLEVYEDRRFYERHYFVSPRYEYTKNFYLKDKEDFFKRKSMKTSHISLLKKLRQKKNKGGFAK